MNLEETQPYPPHDVTAGAPDPPERSRSGCSWAMGLGCGCLVGAGVLMLLLCGGFAYFSYDMVRSIEQSSSDDPAVVAEVTDALVTEIELPRDYQPLSALDYDIPFTKQDFRWVVYEIGEEQGVFAMGAFGPLEFDPEQIMQQFESMFAANPELSEKLDVPEDFSIEARETRDMTINGAPASFLFIEGSSEEEGDFRQVTGSFAGSDGAVLLFLHVDAEAYDESEITGILDSIK